MPNARQLDLSTPGVNWFVALSEERKLAPPAGLEPATNGLTVLQLKPFFSYYAEDGDGIGAVVTASFQLAFCSAVFCVLTVMEEVLNDFGQQR